MYIAPTATVGDKARVEDKAWVGNMARVGGEAWVMGGTWKESPTQIQGSQHFVTHSAPHKITIGCYTYTIKLWLRKYEEIGEEEGYLPHQIEEYKTYIDIIAVKDARLFPKDPQPRSGEEGA